MSFNQAMWKTNIRHVGFYPEDSLKLMQAYAITWWMMDHACLKILATLNLSRGVGFDKTNVCISWRLRSMGFTLPVPWCKDRVTWDWAESRSPSGDFTVSEQGVSFDPGRCPCWCTQPSSAARVWGCRSCHVPLVWRCCAESCNLLNGPVCLHVCTLSTFM